MRIDTDKIKRLSERKVEAQGGEICDWLPFIEFTKLRQEHEVVARSLILNAMVNIHFEAPTDVVFEWIKRHDLVPFLSKREHQILQSTRDQLAKQDLIDLYWYIESLWAFLWATKVIPEMDFTTPIPDSMASLCPDLEENEGDEKFTQKMALRDYDELYAERDLYFRVHWCARQRSLEGRQDLRFDLSRSIERRRALHWIMDSGLDWDHVQLNT